MSKAFVKESDSDADLLYELPAIATGTKNYMTPRAIAICRMSCISCCELSARKWGNGGLGG